MTRQLRAYVRGFVRGGWQGAALFLAALTGYVVGSLLLRVNVWFLRLWVVR
jgi:hypothetical protein